jgi:hypothetical protein
MAKYLKCIICGNSYWSSQQEKHNNSAHHVSCQYFKKIWAEDVQHWLFQEEQRLKRDVIKLQSDMKFFI